MYSTLREAKDGPLKNIASACPDSKLFLSRLNEAIEALMQDDWAGLVAPIHVCVRRGCVVFNRYVAYVRKINFCNQPIPIRNMYGDFIERDFYNHSCGSEFGVTPYGRTPVYSSVAGDSRHIRAYPRANADIGKTVRIFGLDNNNQPLRAENADGSWSDGIVITLAEPYAQTANTYFVRQIDRVLLDEMQGQVLLYAYDTVNSVLENLAVYEPGETNPEYIRYQVNVPCGTIGVNAMVKLRFIPVKFDNDLIFVPLQPLKEMLQSIKFGESGDDTNSIKYEKKAIRKMNQRQNNELPIDQIPVVYGLGFSTYQRGS